MCNILCVCRNGSMLIRRLMKQAKSKDILQQIINIPHFLLAKIRYLYVKVSFNANLKSGHGWTS